jgi:hypothetical protein
MAERLVGYEEQNIAGLKKAREELGSFSSRCDRFPLKVEFSKWALELTV